MRLLALLVVAAGLPLSVSSAYAASPTSRDAGEDSARLVFVLDSSGSMADAAAAGGSKIDAARSALEQVVDRLPDQAQAGIRVFGATVFSRDEAGACTDTQNVVPVGLLDRVALQRAVADYAPYGETPIGAALQGAASDLGPAATGETRTIVLLSDGEPTCPPDPCKVAARLSAKGIDVKINVVGLDVSGTARRVLQCIARAGGGTYVDARTADELARGLVKVSVRDLRLFRLSGTRVEGGRATEQALPLEPGTYLDTSLPDEQKRYYVIGKPAGVGVSVGALVRPPRGEASWATTLVVELSTPEGTSCAREYSLSFQVLGLTPITSTAADYQPFRSTRSEEECARAGQLVGTVTSSAAPGDYRLQVTTWPEMTNVGELPGPLTDDEGPWLRSVSIPAAGRRVPVVGGVSPDDAAELRPGTTYSDTIRPSEQLVYKVHADYGQAIRVSARLGTDPQADRVLGIIGTTAELHAISSLGQALPTASNLARGVRSIDQYGGDEPSVLTAVVPPIRARNLESSDGAVRAASGDGSYYFVLGLGRETSAEASRYEAPVTLRAEVVGEPRGAPEYAGDVEGLPSPSPTEASDSTGPADDATQAVDADRREQDTGGSFPWLPVAIGAGVLALLACAFALGRRTRG